MKSNLLFFKAFLLLSIMTYFIYCAVFGTWHFFDQVDWIIHEAGHLLFMPGGEIIYMAGGSVFQILVPLIIAIYFFKKNDIFATTLILFWLGQSFINVATYMKDAILMQLPLVGGTIHDWNFLFSHFGILASSQLLGSLVSLLGFIIIILSGIFGFYMLVQEDKNLAEL